MDTRACLENVVPEMLHTLPWNFIFEYVYKKISFDKNLVIRTLYIVIGMMMSYKPADALYLFIAVIAK